MDFTKIIIVAVLVEALTEVLKDLVPFLHPKYLALIFAVGMSLVYNVDAFVALGFTCPFPIVSQILTGLLLSRGAQFLHDLAEKITRRDR